MARANLGEAEAAGASIQLAGAVLNAGARRGSGLGAVFGPLARKAAGLSALTAAGQLSFLLALPFLSRLYTPGDFGLFTVYLSVVNIGGPIVGLKFESALYAARSRREASLTLALSILTMAVLATLAAIGFSVMSGHVAGPQGEMLRAAGWMTAFGVLLAGAWSLSSALAITRDALPALGVARFAQPTAMTAFQLLAGLVDPTGVALIAAHLASHVGYTGFLLGRTMTRADLAALHPRAWPEVWRHARGQRSFPLYVLPAQVSALMVGNLPPLLLSSLYGADVAGHFGVAYRIVAAPLAIVSLPLGAILSNAAARIGDFARVRPTALKILAASVGLVSLPLLLLGVLAPLLAEATLGPRWAATGAMLAALAMLAAAQALSTPFTEITSIYRLQRLRFAIEGSTTLAVGAAIGFGALSGWGPLPTVWLLSLAGAAGALIGLALIWRRL